MNDALPTHILNEKLPRFLQKCAQSFESDRRYRNDLRYLRIWLQLMDFVDEPKVLLRTMELNQIGTKRSLFYQAYALYYEKIKKFDEAEKMYHLGVNNFAEPLDDLQKAYEQFLTRLERHKRKIQRQEGRISRRPLSALSENKENREITDTGEDNKSSKKQIMMKKESDMTKLLRNDDTVVVKFVDTAIVGKSEAEDACHHGLVDPTINMKEAMNEINSMFKQPIETAPARRKSHRSQQKGDRNVNTSLEVFVDENPKAEEKGQRCREQASQPQGGSFEIYIDDEGSNGSGDGSNEKDLDESDPEEGENAFVFLRPKDYPSESSSDIAGESLPRAKLREDTVVRRFVGSTISDEPEEVENVCHHGLVDPTINLKEAMEDINNMFGKPIDFVRAKRSRRPEKAPVPAPKQDLGGFSILPDDDEPEPSAPVPPKPSSSKVNDRDLFEPTVFTKQAMDDINKLFGMPLDF